MLASGSASARLPSPVRLLHLLRPCAAWGCVSTVEHWALGAVCLQRVPGVLNQEQLRACSAPRPERLPDFLNHGL